MIDVSGTLMKPTSIEQSAEHGSFLKRFQSAEAFLNWISVQLEGGCVVSIVEIRGEGHGLVLVPRNPT